MSRESLEERIRKVEGVRVAVIGVGYVGLPLAVRLAEVGFTVLGVDIKREVVEQVNAGKSTVEGLRDQRVKDVVDGQRLKVLLANADRPSETDPATLEPLLAADVFIICVPTPLHSMRGWEPEVFWIKEAAGIIERVTKLEAAGGGPPHERLIVLESTTYPGTTRELFSPVLSRFGSQEHRLYLAYSPERTSPGPESFEEDGHKLRQNPSTFQIVRIVGGVDRQSTDVAVALYKRVFRDVLPVEGPETAEMIKLVENTFRFISIGFANEMARIARAFGLNIWDIIDAARTKGFGLDLCSPGLIGGHCLPIDPHYLNWTVRNRRQMATFVDVAESAHQSMRRDAIDLILRLLNQKKRGVPGSSILFFGIAYKKNVGDIRESAVLDLMKRLYVYGADIHFWDPVRASSAVRHRPRLSFSEEECRLLTAQQLESLIELPDGGRYLEPNEMEGTWDKLREQMTMGEFDCIVLATDHDAFKDAYADILLADEAPPIADLRNAVEDWLKGLKAGDEVADRLRSRLQDRARYMLLGVH